MNGGYIIARENFKEAEKHVSAETDPAMFNLLFGLLSLTNQIEADFAAVQAALASLRAPQVKKPQARKPQAKVSTRTSNTRKPPIRKPPIKKPRTGTARRSR
jgi:hypothetical protein